MKTAIFLANGFEECEALITIDMLRRADVNVDLVSIGEDTSVFSSHQICICAEKKLSEISFEDYDALILPGGKDGTDNLLACLPLGEALKRHASLGKLICAICAAPSILGKLNLLKGKQYTCYPGFEGDYGGEYLGTSVVKDENVITAKGMGVTILFAYEIIKTLKGEETAKTILRSIQYE